jgi:peptidoglycan/xylan/chitin deacetylase (PgdA/CDA1 family)
LEASAQVQLNNVEMKFRALLLLISLFLTICRAVQAQSESAFAKIEQYEVYFGKIEHPSGGQEFTLRRFKANNKTYYLSFNPQNLFTEVQPAKNLQVDSLSFAQFRTATAKTGYGKALGDEIAHDQPIQDAGITSGNSTERGINLTVDLCPSQRPLTRDLFVQLVNTFSPAELPAPVSIAVTAVWMQTHPDDLNWLRGMEHSGKLRITWINHSYHHHYDPKLPLPQNFLLEKNTNLAVEVLGNEQAMLEHDLMPSLFFRFPGLVSNRAVFEKITQYGLLPLGSDAWLAKGQRPKKGSVVLVHGNGNEPIGVADFQRLLAQESPLIHQKKWLLLDLEESVSEKELPRN